MDEVITISLKEYNSLIRYKTAHDNAMNAYLKRKKEKKVADGTYRGKGRPRKVAIVQEGI